MSRGMRAWLLVFSLMGLTASIISSYVHYRLLRDPSYTSFCDVSATVSCQAVYESRFGSFLGVPVALGGVIWFGLALLLTLAVPASPRTARAASGPADVHIRAYLFVLSTLALAVVLYLGYASFFVLKTVCMLCIVTYISVIGIFVASGSGQEVPVRTLPGRALADLRAVLARPLALLILVLFAIGAASAVAFFPRDSVAVQASPPPAPAVQPPGGQSEFDRWFASQPRVPLAVANEGAKVVIVKFNDYECPACGQTFLSYRSILAKYSAERPGAVKLVVKDFPLEPECNPGVSKVVHQWACEGAAAVRLARAHGQGEAMEEWLYTHQSTMTPAAVRAAARDVGHVTDFDARYSTVLQSIRGDVEFARQLGIHLTPTFFINGVKVEGGLRAEFFDAAIRYELNRAGQSKAGSARP